MNIKLVFSFLAMALTLGAFIPYIRAILKGDTIPHLFSWLIWGTTTLIIFFAQIEERGGVGAWPIGLSACITLVIAVLACKQSRAAYITKTDWLFLLAALSSIPLWFYTDNPLWAVMILTGVDLLGFGPTFRKAYNYPFEENIPFFIVFIIRNSLVIAALENYNAATLLFPVAVNAACICLVLLILWRRRFTPASS